MKFADIEKFTGYGNYRVDAGWDYVKETVVRYCGYGLDLNPDIKEW